jgi:hypothetical protein
MQKENLLNDIAQNIVGFIDKDNSKFVNLQNKNFVPVEIDSKNFSIIDKSDNDNQNCSVAFIDGGCAEIIKTPNLSLQFIRVYYTIYKNNKRIKNNKFESYALIKSFIKNNEIHYKTQIFGDKIIDEIEVNSFDKTIINGLNRASISVVGNIVRRFFELSVALKLINELSEDDIIVLDGNLDSTFNNENKIIKNLFECSKQKKVLVCSLSKTCELFTDTGASLIYALEQIQPNGCWYYYPIANFKECYLIC